MSIIKKDLDMAFNCGHKLQNICKMASDVKMSGVRTSFSDNELRDLIDLAFDAASHIKWMVAKLRSTNE